MNSSLIVGGTVIDGTGNPGIKADIRIENGVITEIGQLTPTTNERIYEAYGCFVCPGFIESHTHLDGVMWWQADLDPLPGYGITTTVMGHCGFSAAPMSKDPVIRQEMINIFSFFEDIPMEPFRTKLPWDWHLWSEYKASLKKNISVPVNYGTYVGHINLRLIAMGLDAWDRPATPDEISLMANLLDEALSNGAMGLSTNLMDQHSDGRPVPTLKADDAEFSALIDVLSRYPGCSLQLILDVFMQMTAPEFLPRIADLARGKSVRVSWFGIPTMQFQKEIGVQEQVLTLHQQYVDEGLDFWPAFSHMSLVTTLSINYSMLWALANTYVWHEVVQAQTPEQKISLLNDPEWRARARHSLDNDVIPFWPIADPNRLILLNSDNGIGPVKCTVAEYAAQLGVHYSDAMAEWFIRNGVKSTIHLAAPPMDDDMVVQMLRDPRSVANNNDVGAHSQMFCGGGENIILLTKYVKELGTVSIEEAVHAMTGKLAKHFNLSDRGELVVGKMADITVFNLDEIEYREMRKVFDVPDENEQKTWRWTRDPAPVRLTLVNGVATFENGKSTGSLPGELASPQWINTEI